MRVFSTSRERWRSLALPGVLAASLAAAPVGAEEPPMVTDRPDQTESAQVVPRGTTQLEIGWLLSREDEAGARLETTEVPGTLLRFGLSERFELRLGWSGFVDQELSFGGSKLVRDGVGDAALAGKVLLRPERGAAPQVALLFGTSVPVGDDELTSDRYDPSFRFLFSNTLSDTVGIGYNVGMFWETGTGDDGSLSTVSSFDYTLSLGFGVGARSGVFVELFGDVPASASGDPSASFDTGLTFQIRPRVQFDIAAGIGLTDNADDWFVGIGLSTRFPR